jgi:hypothetical protein
MARTFLALLLIMISWFRVAGFDVLEDPDLSDRFELYCSRAAPLLGHGQTARPTGRFIDSEGHSRVSYFRVMERRAAQLLIGATTPWHISKLHNSAVPVTKAISGQLARVLDGGSDRF